VSSVYFWDQDDGFAGVVLIKKCRLSLSTSAFDLPVTNADHRSKTLAVSQQVKSDGTWDSIHVFEATEKGRSTHYKLTSTVILQLSAKDEALGAMNLSGSLTRQAQQEMAVVDDPTQVANVGKMVEEMELKMRNLLRKSLAPRASTCANFC